MQSAAQRLASAQQLLRQNPGIIQATDTRPFPPNVLNAQIRQNLPSDVKTWIQLKQWAAQYPALLPNVDSNKLLILQVLHFQDVVRHSSQAQLTPNQGPVSTSQPPSNIEDPSITVTPQEVLMFRQRLQGEQTSVTDERIRNYILSQKMTGRQLNIGAKTS